jgi:hypothetical protein
MHVEEGSYETLSTENSKTPTLDGNGQMWAGEEFVAESAACH